MDQYREPNRLGFLFGVFAGILLFLAAIITFAGGLASLVTGGYSTNLLVGTTSHIVLEVVIGILFVFFAAVAARRQGDFTLAGGVVLIILSLGTWYVLGLHLFEALAGLFGLIAGILLVLVRH
ncbi:MAG: hypothetical protein WA688_08880 [Thermoplasmata archaeon]